MSLLNEKVALVTGASRGIGRAIAVELAAQGASIAINYRTNGDAAAAVVEEITAGGGNAIALQADVSDFEAATGLVKAVVEQFGRIDILVNNAGTTADTLLMRMKQEQWQRVIDTNLSSVFNCSKAALRPMLRGRRGGRIINITSASGIVGQAGQTNYSASKAGIHGFTKALAKEVGGKQITVNAVAPGLILTDLTANLDKTLVDQYKQVAPLGRLGTLQDVADAVTFLASDRASYITGAILPVDGGVTM